MAEFNSVEHLRVIAQIWRDHWGQDNVNAGYIDRAAAEIEKLRAALASLRRTSHDECEDGFYSCPKHPDYFGNADRDFCECGMDRINEAIDAALGGNS